MAGKIRIHEREKKNKLLKKFRKKRNKKVDYKINANPQIQREVNKQK
jgi:hypothetical protein